MAEILDFDAMFVTEQDCNDYLRTGAILQNCKKDHKWT